MPVPPVFRRGEPRFLPKHLRKVPWRRKAQAFCNGGHRQLPMQIVDNQMPGLLFEFLTPGSFRDIAGQAILQKEHQQRIALRRPGENAGIGPVG